jgi:hypothetical protein
MDFSFREGGKCGVWALGILKLPVLQCWEVDFLSGVNVYCLGIGYIQFTSSAGLVGSQI